MRMLCIMAKSKKKGYLLDNESKMESKTLAKLVGSSEAEVALLLDELDKHGVYSKTIDNVIFNRRMARRAELSDKRAKAGRLGGRSKSKTLASVHSKTQASAVSASVSVSVSNNKKQDKRGCNPSDQEKEVISLYNAITGQNRREAVDIISMIRARLAEGRTVDDFKKVITKKYNQWREDEKMCKFIRPSTLFRPGNFDDYLNEPEPNVKGRESVDEIYEISRAMVKKGVQ